jgi:hypothetical protein
MKPPFGALLIAAMGCATTGPDPTAKLAIATTSPERGTKIDQDTHLRVVGDYALDDFSPGKDRITLVFKSHGGRTWEPREYMLPQAKGQVIFEVGGDELLKEASLVRPLQVLLVLDRKESPARVRTLRASDVVTFDAAPTAEDDAKLKGAKLLPPQIGRGQLLSDVVHDPRYRPHLPKELNVAGHSYWGIYKVCVDNDGGVFSVKMLRSAHPLVDDQWMALIRRYEHRPYTINGVPVVYCYPLRLEVRSAN